MSWKSVFNFLLFFQIYFILFQTLLIDLFFVRWCSFSPSEFYWLFLQLILSARFFNAVSFPVQFSFCWDRQKIDHRTWISRQNVMPLTRGIATVSLHWFCLWFWKQLVYLGQSWLCDLVHISLQKCGLLWTQHILLRNQCLKYNHNTNLFYVVAQSLTVKGDRKQFLELYSFIYLLGGKCVWKSIVLMLNRIRLCCTSQL